MRYLPKSKLGAVIAGLYLLLIIAVSLPLIFNYGDSNVHSGNWLFALLVFYLTLPFNVLLFFLLDFLKMSNKSVEQFFIFIFFALCAIVNAALIYFVVGWIKQLFAALYRKLTEKG